MHILYLSQYFPPEAGATQTRAYEMARTFVRLGHSVTMISEIPNHPSGIIPPQYRGKLYERQGLDGIDVIRVWVKASQEKNFGSRLRFYLSFMVTATLAGLLLARDRYDMIYCSSPPLFVGGVGLSISRLKHLPFIFEVRDLWPESAVALGELSNPRWIRWAERLEQACYQRAKRIVIVTQGIQQRLIDRRVPGEKLILIPNGANLDLFRFQLEDRARLRTQLGWEDCFIAVYAGIFGLAQDLETIIQAAENLHDHPSIRFLLIGEGPRKEDIVSMVAGKSLSNVIILPEQPREAIPGYLSAADISLVPLRGLDLFKGALPTKIFDAWACERPVIISIDGEARQMIEVSQAGHYVPPEDPRALAQALIDLQSNPGLCAEMGENGRKFTAENYSRPALAEKLIKILETSANARG